MTRWTPARIRTPLSPDGEAIRSRAIVALSDPEAAAETADALRSDGFSVWEISDSSAWLARGADSANARADVIVVAAEYASGWIAIDAERREADGTAPRLIVIARSSEERSTFDRADTAVFATLQQPYDIDDLRTIALIALRYARNPGIATQASNDDAPRSSDADKP